VGLRAGMGILQREKSLALTVNRNPALQPVARCSDSYMTILKEKPLAMSQATYVKSFSTGCLRTLRGTRQVCVLGDGGT
jgi:hypothetical protein